MAGASIIEVARQEAERILEEEWDGVYPVDPFEIATSLGFDVYSAHMKNGLSGQIVATDDGKVSIYVERSESDQRQAFTVAHEIGHWAERDRKGRARGFSFRDDRAALIGQRVVDGKYDLHEFFANEFAGNLLMPEDDFREFVKSYEYGARELAARFGVSVQAVKVRAKRLGIAL